MPISTLQSIAVQMRKSYPSFGGVMLWDASQAYGKKFCSLGSPHGLAQSRAG